MKDLSSSSSQIAACWLRLDSSPAIKRLAALELVAQGAALGLSHDVQRMLLQAAHTFNEEETAQVVFQSLGIHVDVEALNALARRQEALTYLVQRQTHWTLLRKLFGATREEIKQIRQATGASPPPLRHMEIPGAVLRDVCTEWSQLVAQHADSSEPWTPWVWVARRCGDYPVSALHQALVVDAFIAMS